MLIVISIALMDKPTNHIIERNCPMIEDLLRFIILSPSKGNVPVNYKWLVRFRHRFSCPTRPYRII